MSVSVSTTTAHHGPPAHEVVLLLETDPHRGLPSGEAADRLERFGPNTLPVAAGAGLLVNADTFRIQSCRCRIRLSMETATEAAAAMAKIRIHASAPIGAVANTAFMAGR